MSRWTGSHSRSFFYFFICKTDVVKNKNWQRYSFGVFNNVNFIGNIVFNN